MYSVVLHRNSDDHVVDYDVIEDEGGQFATEDAAADWARAQLTALEHCRQCGNMHVRGENPCYCNVCGMPTADGHWHPNVQ